MRRTLEERVLALKLYFREGNDTRRTRRAWPANTTPPPSGRTLRSLADRFAQYGSIADAPRPGKPSTVVENLRNTEVVRESVLREPMLSSRRRARRLGLSRSSLLRILRRLSIRPYKLQVAHMLLPIDLLGRMQYCRAILRLFAASADLPDRLIMSDEAHFHLTGEVFNRQNVRFWGTANPHIVRAKDPHADRLTVWCGICSAGILGPYFFEDPHGRAQSVTGERYRAMLREFVFPRLDELQRGDAANPRWWWWQQDGATSHTARDTMRMLIERFGEDRLISRAGPRAAARESVDGAINWPSRSPDLSAADFFLWGYLKDRVYDVRSSTPTTNAAAVVAASISPGSLRELRDNLRREIDILNDPTSEPMRRAVMREVIERARDCEIQGGGHLRNVLFKSSARFA